MKSPVGDREQQILAETPFAPFGELKFSLTYSPKEGHLSVRIIKADNLMKGSELRECNSFVKVILVTNQVAKQHTHIVKATKTPVFDKRLLFQGVTVPDLSIANLKMKVYTKTSSTISLNSKRTLLGEVTLPLADFSLSFGNEIKMWRKLQDRSMVGSLAAFIRIPAFYLW